MIHSSNSSSVDSESSDNVTGSANGRGTLVLIVLHGMGSQKWFPRNVDWLKQSISSLLTIELSELANIQNIKVLPVEYHTILHGLDSTDERVRSIQLSTCTGLRSIINDYVCDPLYYFSCRHGGKLRNIVVQLMNTAFADYLLANDLTIDTFEGNVAVLAHSMGGIIMWDVLDNDRRYRDWKAGRYSSQPTDREKDPLDGIAPFDFNVTNVFCMGSPISNTVVLRQHQISDYAFSDGVAFWNIYHPLDPIAFRLEPLYDMKYRHISPINVKPYSDKPFHVRLKENLNASLLSFSSSIPFSQLSLGLSHLSHLSQLSAQLPPLLPPLSYMPRPSIVLASGVDRATRSMRLLLDTIAAVTRAGHNSILEYTYQNEQLIDTANQEHQSVDTDVISDGYASDTEEAPRHGSDSTTDSGNQGQKKRKRKRLPNGSNNLNPMHHKGKRSYRSAASTSLLQSDQRVVVLDNFMPVSPPHSDLNHGDNGTTKEAINNNSDNDASYNSNSETSSLISGPSVETLLVGEDGDTPPSDTDNQSSELFSILARIFSPFSTAFHPWQAEPREGDHGDNATAISNTHHSHRHRHRRRGQRHHSHQHMYSHHDSHSPLRHRDGMLVDTPLAQPTVSPSPTPISGSKLARSRRSKPHLSARILRERAEQAKVVEENDNVASECIISSTAETVSCATDQDTQTAAMLNMVAAAAQTMESTEQSQTSIENVADALNDENIESTSSETPQQKLMRRLDYALPCALVDSVTNEYIVGLRAHFSYWRNKDMMWFILKKLNDTLGEQMIRTSSTTG